MSNRAAHISFLLTLEIPTFNSKHYIIANGNIFVYCKSDLFIKRCVQRFDSAPPRSPPFGGGCTKTEFTNAKKVQTLDNFEQTEHITA